MLRALFPAALALGASMCLSSPAGAADTCPAFLNHEFRKLHSAENVNLCAIAAGKPLLIVNTASHCGYTPQFKQLEALHRKYQPRGLVVIGFASDDFNQEAKDEAEAADICYVNYGVTFTMLSPSPVTGKNANPVFRELNRVSEQPSWNFNKYVVSADGRSVRHFDSEVTPSSATLTQAVEAVLN
jgi:glutathione peroxidase